MILLHIQINEDDGFLKRFLKRLAFGLLSVLYFGGSAMLKTMFVKIIVFSLIHQLFPFVDPRYAPTFLEIFWFFFSMQCLEKLLGMTHSVTLKI